MRNGTECQEVQFSNLRIQEIHASPRNLSQLVTTFFGSRAEPSPSRVVAFCNFYLPTFYYYIDTGLIVSPLVSRHIDSIWSLRPLRLPAGRNSLDHFPLYVPIQGCTKSKSATYLRYMNYSGHSEMVENSVLRAGNRQSRGL